MNKMNNTDFFYSFENKPFSIMAKPIGSVCNVNCTYCYYLEKKYLFPKSKDFRMSDDVLEEYIAQYIQSQTVANIGFLWHGGEPLLRGIDFFKKVIRLQKKYSAGRIVTNSLQTNGLLVDDEWCTFFNDNKFLIGISIDGPESLHNQYRKTYEGIGTFKSVMDAINLLVKHKLDFNTLSVVNNLNVDHPLEVYRFLKSIGSHYMQFIPIVERNNPKFNAGKMQLLTNKKTDSASVTEWSVNSLKYGVFLNTIFDEWIRYDVGTYFVQMFDATLANWVNEQPGVCVMAPKCGNAGVIEHNGDVYSCDHFVFPEYYLGNITNRSLSEMMNSITQQLFGDDKYQTLPLACKQCKFLDKCWGECPRNRFLTTNDGEYGLNYLCEGLKLYFSHVSEFMDFMANKYRNKRSPANVMKWIRTTK